MSTKNIDSQRKEKNYRSCYEKNCNCYRKNKITYISQEWIPPDEDTDYYKDYEFNVDEDRITINFLNMLQQPDNAETQNTKNAKSHADSSANELGLAPDSVNSAGNHGSFCPYKQFDSGNNQSKAYKNRCMIYIFLKGEIFQMALFLQTDFLREFWNTIQLAFAAVRGWLEYFLGGFDSVLMILVLFAITDYITSVMCAATDHGLPNEIGFKEIYRKVLIFLLVAIANIIDVEILKNGRMLRTVVVFFYLNYEGISLLENVAHLGLPIPKKLKVVLEQLHDRSQEEIERKQ